MSSHIHVELGSFPCILRARVCIATCIHCAPHHVLPDTLIELHLGHNEIRGAALSGLRGLATLSVLRLECNRIESLDALPPLAVRSEHVN